MTPNLSNDSLKSFFEALVPADNNTTEAGYNGKGGGANIAANSSPTASDYYLIKVTSAHASNTT